MIFNSQGDAKLRQYINGQTITPGATAITLPKGAQLLGDVIIEAVDTEKPYNKELEYIESSGTEYIDTGFKPNQNTRVVMQFEPTAAYSSITAFFGVRDVASATAPTNSYSGTVERVH